MAPDLNSVPASPRISTNTEQATNTNVDSHQSSTNVSRRTSQIAPMSPPPLPLASPGGANSAPAPGSSNAFPSFNASFTGATNANAETTGVPMRHPRPMTAAEMHLELEKEQEAVVNRLTRELSALRAHSASVASTTSSTTSGAPGVLLEATDPSVTHAGALTGPTHPTASRSHRSSSSVSRSSVNAAPYATGHTSVSSAVPHRYSISSQASGTDNQIAPPRNSTINLSTPRYEEVAHYRQELEEAKKENESLRKRIKDLESMLKTRRESGSEILQQKGNIEGESADGAGGDGDAERQI